MRAAPSTAVPRAPGEKRPRPPGVASRRRRAPPPAATPDEHVATATAFYERAWSSPDGAALLPSLVADDHAQSDVVWQAGVTTVGRDRLAKGMRHMRRVYPDLAFTVTRAAPCGAAAAFVEWAMTGTFEGRADAATGVTVMTFDSDGRVASSAVYRAALPAEVDLAERKRGGPVRQGVLLEG